jgi:uncharacterized protein
MRTRRCLVWDAPNIDLAIASIVGARPTPAERPDFLALARWFVSGGDGMENEAAVFVNVPEYHADRLQQWVVWLLSVGYRVFAKPRTPGSDVDADMVRYLMSQREDDDLAEVVVASHDANNFLEPLEKLAADGVTVTVIGFAEQAGRLSRAASLRFVDFADIPELFKVPLPRVDLTRLPVEGRWFEPRVPLAAAEDPEPYDESVTLRA